MYIISVVKEYRTVKNFGGEKTLANLVNHNNSPTFFTNFPVLQYGAPAKSKLRFNCFEMSKRLKNHKLRPIDQLGLGSGSALG